VSKCTTVEIEDCRVGARLYFRDPAGGFSGFAGKSTTELFVYVSHTNFADLIDAIATYRDACHDEAIRMAAEMAEVPEPVAEAVA